MISAWNEGFLARYRNEAGILLLKNFKRKSNLTWPEVAKTLGISVSYIGNLASGARRITPHIRMLIEHPNLRDRYKKQKS